MEWSDFGYTLKVEPARFADGLNVGFERKRGFKDDFPGFWHETEMFVEEALGEKRHEELVLREVRHLNEMSSSQWCYGSGLQRRGLC